MADERSRLHEIVDQLPEGELALACQLLELLARGRGAHGAAATNGHEDDGEPGPQAASPARTASPAQAASPAGAAGPSPETISRLAELTDEELLHLDDLLETDPEGARRFWRERFGQELPDADLGSADDEDG